MTGFLFVFKILPISIIIFNSARIGHDVNVLKAGAASILIVTLE